MTGALHIELTPGISSWLSTRSGGVVLTTSVSAAERRSKARRDSSERRHKQGAQPKKGMTMKTLIALFFLLPLMARAGGITVDRPLTVTVPDDWTVREFTFSVNHNSLRPYVISVKAKTSALELDSGEVVRNADYLWPEACQAALILPWQYTIASLSTYTCESGYPLKYVGLYRGTYTIRVASWNAGQYVVSVRSVEDTRQ